MNYSMKRGDSKVIEMPIVEDGDDPADLSGVTPIVTAKSNVS